VSLILSCPSGQTPCNGTALLRTATAVTIPSPGVQRGHASKGGAKRTRKIVLVLGSASFKISGGASKIVSIRLSAQAMALLRTSGLLRAIATIIAKSPQGATAVTKSRVVTLRLERSPAGRRHNRPHASRG
jgi:hypothetical protein